MIAEFRAGKSQSNKSTVMNNPVLEKHQELTSVEDPNAAYRIVEYPQYPYGLRFHVERKKAGAWMFTLECFASIEEAIDRMKKLIEYDKQLEQSNKHYYLKPE